MYDRNVLTAMSMALLVLIDSLSCNRVLRVAYSSLVRDCKSFLSPAILRPFCPQVVAVYLFMISIYDIYLCVSMCNWYPFLKSWWCDLGSACAQSDQSFNCMLMIF